MKLGRFIKWQLKEWLAVLIILAVIAISFYWTNCYQRELIRSSYPGSRYDTGLTTIFFSTLLATFVLPFFVYSHRFSKQAADAFNSFPATKNIVTRTKLLIGAAYIAALLTVVYWIGFLIVVYRYNFNPINDLSKADQAMATRYEINFGYYVPAYFAILASLLISYFFNCLMCSFGGTLANAILFVFGGNLLTLILVSVLSETIIRLGSNRSFLNWLWSWMILGGIGSEYHFSVNLFAALIKGDEISEIFEGAKLASLIIGVLIHLGTSIFLWFTEEPSGEKFGVPGASKGAASYIVYTCLGLVMVEMANISGKGFSIPDFLALVVVVISVYLVMAISEKRFKFTKREWIIFFAICACYVVLKLAYVFTDLNVTEEINYL